MIPRTIHFIWIKTTRPFEDFFLFCILSAVVNTTCKVILHTDEDIKIPGVEIRKRIFPTQINNIDIDYFECLKVGQRVSHVKDIIRLDVLHEEGGIYSDCDVLWLRNPWEYWDKKVVIGYTNQGYKILCNAVIMSEAGHPALLQYKEWLIKTYPPKKYWIPANPYKLWKDNKDITCVNKKVFFPIKYNSTVANAEDCKESVCCHLAKSMTEKAGSLIDILKKDITRFLKLEE